MAGVSRYCLEQALQVKEGTSTFRSDPHELLRTAPANYKLLQVTVRFMAENWMCAPVLETLAAVRSAYTVAFL
jgi:hypothetical protein